MDYEEYCEPAPTGSYGLEVLLGAAATAARAYGALQPTERAAVLEALSSQLEASAEALVVLADRETHLGIERLRAELVRTCFQLRLFANVVTDGEYLGAMLDRAAPDWPSGSRPDLRRVLRPLGPVVVFAASNFPFAFSVAGGDTASALAAGCPVVLKAHPGHPLLSQATAEVVVDSLERSGAPAGVFSVIYGEEAGRSAVVDPRIAAAAFTGSLRTGRILFDLAASRPVPIPFYGELGSLNPVFVTAAALARRRAEIVDGFVNSFTLGLGQFCTKPGVLLVPAGAGVEDELAVALAGRQAALLLNDHTHRAYLEGLSRLTAHPSVRVLVSGTSHLTGEVGPSLLATSVEQLLAHPGALLVECFGPVAVVASYRDERELLKAAGKFEGQLTASMQAEEDDQIAPELVERLAERAGRVLWNEWPTGVSVTWAMHHGGPYPATTSSLHTSVGATAIARFLRPVTYQSVPAALLPPALRDDNPLGLPRHVDGRAVVRPQTTVEQVA